jgi:hypothetical protein
MLEALHIEGFSSRELVPRHLDSNEVKMVVNADRV